MNTSVFISYSSKREEFAKLLVDYLHRRGIREIWFDREKVGAGQPIKEEIRSGLSSSACCVFVLDPSSAQSSWCFVEVGAFWGAGKRVIIYKPEEDCPLPDFFHATRFAKTKEEVLAACRKELPPPGPKLRSKPTGVVSSETLHNSKERLPGEVFAIELLRRPIRLSRKNDGHVTVTIDREGVDEILISNEGKKTKVQQYVTAANIDELLKADREIHRYMLGGGPDQNPYDIDLEKRGIRLRRVAFYPLFALPAPAVMKNGFLSFFGTYAHTAGTFRSVRPNDGSTKRAAWRRAA